MQICVGFFVGSSVGSDVGFIDGDPVGCDVGAGVGFDVGAGVGSLVGDEVVAQSAVHFLKACPPMEQSRSFNPSYWHPFRSQVSSISSVTW